jgi:transposase
MAKLSDLERLSEPDKEALMAALWAAVQTLNVRLAALEAKPYEPCKDAHHSSVPPSRPLKVNRSSSPRMGVRREASVGRAGGGRPRHPEPDHVIIAQAKTCPHCGGMVSAHEQHLQAVYDQMALPAITPIVTRLEQHGGPCPHCGQCSVAPVPVGMEPGTPFGASIERLAPDLR